MAKRSIVLMVCIVLGFTLSSKQSFAQIEELKYAYIEVNGKVFTKKLKVGVDFGDSLEEREEGRRYSEILSEKKSYAAVLNYMVEHDFELVETLDFVRISEGSGGTNGLVFIMRKMKSK